MLLDHFLQGHVSLWGDDAVRVLAVSLFGARWCGSPGPKSLLVMKWSRRGSGTHLDYTVGSQTKMWSWVEQITSHFYVARWIERTLA